jgi:hypothetical protein
MMILSEDTMFYCDPVTEVRLSRFEQRQLDQRLEVMRLTTPPLIDGQPTSAGFLVRVGSYLGQIRPLAWRSAAHSA